MMTDETSAPRTGNIDLLVQTVQDLSMATDLEGIMRIVRTVARKITGADGATFVLRDRNLCYYADEDAISPLWKGNRFPMETCISGWVMLNKTVAVIPDVFTDPRIPADVYRATFVKSMVMVPIRTMNPLGAIGNYWAQPHTATAEEVALLQSLANITAVSIQNIEVRNRLEEKVLERTRELSESLAREKEMNEMKSAFVSYASHEFRTPLSSISTSVDLIEAYRQREETDKQSKHIEKIKLSVQGLTHLLNNFLSLEKLESRKATPERTVFDAFALLQGLAEEMELANKNTQKVLYTHLGTHMVYADRNILRNVVLNLLSSALKYSEKDVLLRSEFTNGRLVVSVEDKGIGIPESEHAKVFSKFFRAGNTDNIKGTGLGLMIVKRYVELLNGKIGFTSGENMGTTFIVDIPAAVPPQ